MMIFSSEKFSRNHVSKYQKKPLARGLVCLAVFLTFGIVQIFAAVSTTPASGGTSISADKANNSTSGSAYTQLGNIVVAEGDAADIKKKQTGKTLILTAPSNRKFRANSGSISYTAGRDISAAAISVTTTHITVTITILNDSTLDTFTISGVQVQAISGNTIPTSGNILRTCNNSGTLIISGIICDSTNFGSLSQAHGSIPPSTSLVSPTSGAQFSGNVPFVRSGSDNIAVSGYTFQILTTGGTIIYSSGTYATTTGLSFITGDGTYLRNVIAMDSDGNTGTAISRSFTIDTTSPAFTGVISGATYNTGIIITFSDNNPGATATVNGYGYTNGALITGANTYTFFVTDSVGNSTGAIFTINYSGVIITPGNPLYVSADKAANSLSGSTYTALSNIILNEGSTPNFGEGTGITFILTAPSNRRFRAGSGNVTYMGGTRNIKSGSLVVTDSTITAIFDIVGTDLSDAISITNIQAQAITGNIIPASGNITRTCANPGTASIFGIVCDSTNFGSFSQIIGAASKLITTLPGQVFVNGLGNSGIALNQTAGVSFDIVKLSAVDQFFHIVASYAGNKTISYTGVVGTFTTNVSFASGQSITTLSTQLDASGTGVTITANNGTISGIPSSSFDVAYAPDTRAPTLTEITKVTTPTNDTTPDYTFSSDETGTINYSGDCSSPITGAIVGNNTITFNTLSTGAHSNCKIRVTDIANNPSDRLSVTSFTIDISAPFVDFIDDVALGPVTGDTIIGNRGNATIAKWMYTEGSSCPMASGTYTNNSGVSMTQTTESNNGKYICLYGENAAGNTGIHISINKINIDTTFPIFTGVVSGAIYTTGIIITFSDNNTGAIATIDDDPYTGASMTENGLHVFVVTDSAGNSTGATFTIDFYENIIITPSNEIIVSADKAANAYNGGSYTTLSNIIFNEGSPTNFGEGTGTLILTAPNNRKFKTGVGNVSCMLGTKNIKSCSAVVTDSTITVTFYVVGTDLYDSVAIYNIQAQAITGNIIPASGNITRTCANPGTASIFGIVCDSTNFGSFSQTIGAAYKMITTLPGQTFINGLGNSGSALFQTAGISFDIVKLSAVDQFFHIIASYAGNKTISYTGVVGTFTTNVSFASGQSTTALITTLVGAGTNLTIAATDGTLSGIASSSFSVIDIIPPILTLTGNNPQTIEIGDAYIEFSAIAYDTGDGGDISSSIIINTGDLIISATGSYTVTYDVSDSSNNAAAQITRTVNVVDTTKPVITLSGANPVTVEVGGSYTDAGATAYDKFYGTISSRIITSGSVNINAVGSYAITYNVTDINGNTGVQVTRTVNVVDTAKPIITLIGDNPQYIVYGSGYIELGAIAYDTGDGGDISSGIIINTGAVNTSITGSYAATYNITDSHGNAATQVTRTVNVISVGVPRITLLGSTPVTLEVGSSYTDAGATAYDTEDGDLTANIAISGIVDSNIIGSYTITYDVSDSSGNAAIQVTRTINIVDITKPVITLIGANPINIGIHSIYTDAGATAYDNYDGDLTRDIFTFNPVDTDTTGSYTVTYDVSDSSNNAATQITRTVNVVNTTPVVSNLSANVLSDTAAEIRFTTDILSQGYVRYGIDSLTNIAIGSTETTHIIHLSGLSFNTTYIYRAFAKTATVTGELSATGTFTTPLVHLTGLLIVTGQIYVSSGVFTGKLILTDGLNTVELSGFSNTSRQRLFAPQEASGIADFGETGIPAPMEGSVTRTLLKTVKVGGMSGVHMMNDYFRVQIIIPSGTHGQVIKIYRSNDGDTRTENTPSATCTLDVSLSCSFFTEHLSYFTVIAENTHSSENGGKSILQKDMCPQGDLSPNYYDGTCSVLLTAASGTVSTRIHKNTSGAIWSEESLQAFAYAKKIGFTKASTIGSSERYSTLTRYDLAKLISLYATKVLGKKTDTTLPCTFKDVKKNQKYYIQSACQLGFMGYMDDGKTLSKKFNPAMIVSRSILGTVFSRLLYGSSTGDYLNMLKQDAILSDTTPTRKETKGNAMLMLLRAQHHIAK